MAHVDVNNIAYGSAQFSRFSSRQTDRLYWASLELLERKGVMLHEPAAVELLQKGGAEVCDGNIVRIPAGLVEKAFSTVPKRVVLFDRNRRAAMPLEGSRCFYGPGSDTLNIIDHRSGQRRKPVLADVREGTLLCDALENIDFVMSMVLPTDVPQEIADTFQMQAMLNHSVKPIIIVSYGLQGLVDAVEMAEAVMGGADALRRYPLVTCYINVISGLNHNREALQKLLYLADKGLPAMYIPSTISGVNSPITPAGAAVLDSAGVLAGLVLSQLKREGAPYIVPGMPPSPMDMRSMTAPYADPQRGFMTALARRYGLPAFGLGGCSDAKLVDQQAAAEAALTLLAESLLGGNIIHDLGYLESGLTFSLPQLAICEEMVGWIATFLNGPEVDDEAIALDVIAAVGHSGEYLGHDHTARNFRKAWYPNLFERDAYDVWELKGAKSLLERAAARVDQILNTHRPEPLPRNVQQRLQRIVERTARTTG